MVIRLFVSVDLADEPGALGEMAHRLAEGGVNIEGFSVEMGTVRFLTHDPRQAQRILADAGHTPRLTKAMEIHLRDEPGQLAHLMDRLAARGVRIISTFGVAHGGDATLYVRCDDEQRAAPIVQAFARQATVTRRPEVGRGTLQPRP